MRNVFNAMACVVVLLTAVRVCDAAGRDAFEGMWKVTVTPDDGGKAYEDTLTFKNGKFTSENGKKHEFAETEYEGDFRGGQIGTFTATAKSKKEGSAKWTGTLAAGQIQGTLAWTKGDGSVVNYTYMGARKEK
jgi:hypothetical protein